MKELVELTLPAKPEYASVLRLMTAAVVCRLNASFDEVEDLRVMVSEAFTQLLTSKDVKVRITMEGSKVEISFTGDSLEHVDEEDLGMLILSSLSDELRREGNTIYLIKTIKDISNVEEKCDR